MGRKWRCRVAVDRRPRRPTSAGVAPDAEPESKYAVDPPPVRAMTRDEVLGPNPCAEVCPKYPQSTAARLVAYVLGKVDHVTQGVESDFRYYLRTNEDWRKTRERIIEIHEAGEENAAEVLHESTSSGTTRCARRRATGVPAGRLGRHEAAIRALEGPGARALAYPDSDADEEDVPPTWRPSSQRWTAGREFVLVCGFQCSCVQSC